MPAVGVNDVLIRVDRTGICGTDLHIYKWGCVGAEDHPGSHGRRARVRRRSRVRGGERGGLLPGRHRKRGGHVVCGRCRNCLAGRRHLCRDTQGIGVNRAGAFAEYIAVADDQWSAPPTRYRPRRWRRFSTPLECVHTALSFPVLGEDVLGDGRGPDWDHGSGSGTPCRRTVCGGHRPERIPADPWPNRLGATVALDIRHGRLADVQQELGMREGFEHRPRDVGPTRRHFAT